MTGVVSAPARVPVLMCWGIYGTISGGRSHPRGRVWIMADDADVESRLTCRIAWNHPTTGRVVYEDLGTIAKATIRGQKSCEIWMADGTVITAVAAPCVCAAGAVGNAMPQEGRIRLQYVTPHGRPVLTVL